MPVLTLAEKSTVSTALPIHRVVRAVVSPLHIPAWFAVAIVALASLTGFVVGRHKPAHHYVSYFGYPMVLDTVTGKACYSAPPKPADPATVQDAAYPPGDSSSAPLDPGASASPAIPLCGQE